MKQIDEWEARKRRVMIEYVSSRHRKADGQGDQRAVGCDGQVHQAIIVWKEGDFSYSVRKRFPLCRSPLKENESENNVEQKLESMK